MKIYTVYDVVLKKCGPLLCFADKINARRHFLQLINAPEMKSIYNDFELHYLGEFDENIEGFLLESPSCVLTGKDAYQGGHENV